MGWKCTQILTRQEAINLIVRLSDVSILESLSDDDLSNVVDGFCGDNMDMPYYGCNFMVSDVIDND